MFRFYCAESLAEPICSSLGLNGSAVIYTDMGKLKPH